MARNLKKGPKIGIIGAGIGGLTTAIALQQKGFRVVVYEQSSQLGEVGAGITLTINAGRVFKALGLGEQLAGLENPTPSIGILDYKTGKQLSYQQNKVIDASEATRQVHRADLHSVLSNALISHNESLRLNHKLIDIEQNTASISLQFSNGQTEHCNTLIACDGLKSTVRQRLFELEPAEFTGFVAWRGLVEQSLLPNINFDPHFAAYSSENKLFARYPIRHGSLINYVAIARKSDFRSESWNEKAEVAEVVSEFKDWHHEVRDIIQATHKDCCMRWALYTRQPLDTWVLDRVALLGDAAHPMTPFYGMGAAMAVEDAFILSRCFEKEKDNLQEALKRYEKARLERGNMMQRMSLERADGYMNSNPSARAQAPGAGLTKIMEYDPVTATI